MISLEENMNLELTKQINNVPIKYFDGYKSNSQSCNLNINAKKTAILLWMNFSKKNCDSMRNNDKDNTYCIKDNTKKDVLCNMSDSFATIEQIMNFKKNWNGYDAEPFKKEHLDKVKGILITLPVQPEVFPTANGSVQLEYTLDDKYLEFEIFDNDTIIAYQQMGNSEREFLVNNVNEMKKAICELYERKDD